MICPVCRDEIPDGSQTCPYCGAFLNQQTPGEPPALQPTREANAMPPLKWYKFIIYFQLWAMAAYSLYTNILYLTGGICARR